MNEPVQAAIAAVYASVLEPEGWPDTLVRLAAAFEAPMATVWHYDPVRGQVDAFLSHGHDPVSEPLYAGHYITLDPARPVVLSAGVGQWLGDEALLNPAASAHRTYWSEFARPFGIGRVGGGKVVADGAGLLYLGVQRGLEAEPFGDAASRIFSIIAPHLAQADAMRRRLTAATAGQQLAQDALDRLAAPIAVVDGAGRVLLANAAAARGFAVDGPLRLRHGRVVADTTLQGWWARSLTGACRVGGSGSETRHAPAGPPGWLISLLPMPERHALAESAAEPAALLTFARDGGSPPDAGLLQRLFGLTPAESGLLAALASGEMAPAYARRRGLSIHTVRSHAAALLDKMGCQSQLELVALARTLPIRGD